jgi:hypothetical protein
MIARISCPDMPAWEEFLDGSHPVADRAELARHLEECPRCLQTLERLTAASRPWPNPVRPPAEPAPAPGLARVLRELKEEGGRAEGSTAPEEDSQETVPFLQPPVEPGQLGRFAGYEVLGVIGRGGMGVVLKAIDPALGRLVAIKVLAPQWATSTAARQRFAREARATAAIRHEHVVAIHAVNEQDGLPYLVMEYVHGMSLQQRLDQTGPLRVEEIVRIGLQTAAGLGAAHAHGLIHRDVKPANILLENGVECVKLSDFGLARAIDDASLTQSGVIAGTPQYMAPEQARGAALDHRADLFSLGSVLYALCTGRPPFRAPTTLAVLRRVCDDTPRPIQDINPDIPDWLVEIIATLHAKEPADRFQAAAEVADLLGAHLAHLQNPRLVLRPRRWRPRWHWPRRWRWWHWVGVVMVLGVVPAAAVSWLLPGQEPVTANNGEGPPPAPAVVVPVPAVIQVPVNPAPAAKPIWVTLSGGSVTRPKIGLPQLTFQVNYRFEQGSPAAAAQWVWVVRSSTQTVFTKTYGPGQLGLEGTLQNSHFQPGPWNMGPFETYLVRQPLPGLVGAPEETVSNVLLILPGAFTPFGPKGLTAPKFP